MFTHDWRVGFVMIALSGFAWGLPCPAQDTDDGIAGLIAERCSGCHGETEPAGELRLNGLDESALRSLPPEQLWKLFRVVESAQMPPETEAPLEPVEQSRLSGFLKAAFYASARDSVPVRNSAHRLTRLQYNNAVRDLFQLNRDVFELPEKLMLRRDEGVYQAIANGHMPAEVRVVSNTLTPEGGLSGVQSFPRDLPAEHGFDNQADKLTMSPLLLESFLRLSVSIIESPDFHAQSVGCWDELFAAPSENADISVELRNRLRPFLRRAFRAPVDDATLDRYVSYAEKAIGSEASFEHGMKQVASAILCSPRFLFHLNTEADEDQPFERASRLSFFLWNSIPDEELLDLAESGRLNDPEVLKSTVRRMMQDRRMSRFLDAFPAQWLRLENVFAATPDAARSPYFNFDELHPASSQMVLEPLVLFDALYAEDRPVRELLDPPISYRSDFLTAWYETDMKPSRELREQLTQDNEKRRQHMDELRADIDGTTRAIRELLQPVRRELSARISDAASGQQVERPAEMGIDLQPMAEWEFNGDLNDVFGRMSLTAHGEIQFEDGRVVLRDAFLQSPPVSHDLRAKTMEVWCRLPRLDQHGGGLMSLEGPNTTFDAIVMGERRPNEWISGSNHFQRTTDFEGAVPETEAEQDLHLVMVYRPNGTIQLYRNGQSYGRPYHRPGLTFPAGQSFILFGLRHLPAGGNRFLNVLIDKARLYDRALTTEEIQQAFEGKTHDFSEEELAEHLSAESRDELVRLREKLKDQRAALAGVEKPLDDATLNAEIQRRHDDGIRQSLQSDVFRRAVRRDARFGGVVTNAAVLTMTSGRTRTQPIARGAWIIDVVFNDPPPPPPNDVPPLNEESLANVPIREQFAIHRANASCAGCHSRIDPLGFALENYDVTGRWRETYESGAPIDASGTLFRRESFQNAVEFQRALLKEERRFVRAFAAHLLRYAEARELDVSDHLRIEMLMERLENQNGDSPIGLQSLIREVALSGMVTESADAQ